MVKRALRKRRFDALKLGWSETKNIGICVRKETGCWVLTSSIHSPMAKLFISLLVNMDYRLNGTMGAPAVGGPCCSNSYG